MVDNWYNLSKVKDRAYITNPDKYNNIRTYWVAIYIKNNKVTYFKSASVDNISEWI